jgi:hypothetical protein
MKNQILVGGTILILATTSVLGADNMNNDQDQPYDPGDLYRANELSMDVFGSASLGKYSLDHLSTSRIRHDTRLGAGLGLTYFFTRNLGIGAEAYSEDTDGVFIDSASANLTARFPVGDSGFAPYVFGGGGQQFDLNKLTFGQAGGGIEYRFTPRVGAFTDVRMVWPTETRYFGVARLGVRFAF